MSSVQAPLRAAKRQDQGRIPVVDGLRGAAILLVLVYHIHLFASPRTDSWWERAYAQIAGLGWIGVDLFFVLSGFLITGILLQAREHPHYYRNFYARRTVRIFPLYYASLALFFGVAPVVLRVFHRYSYVGELVQPSTQVYAWLYALNWRMGLLGFASAPEMLNHFWSLSIEEQFYLAWPSVVKALRRRGLAIGCWVLIAVSLASRIFFFHRGMAQAAYVLTFCRLDALAVGALVAMAFRDTDQWNFVKRFAPVFAGVSVAGLAFMIGMTGSVWFGDVWMGTAGISLWALFFGSCLALALRAGDGSRMKSGLSSRTLRFFGKYSYGLYVCHQPLILVLVWAGLTSERMTHVAGNRILAVAAVNAVCTALAILIALASWNVLEKHFLKLKDRFPE